MEEKQLEVIPLDVRLLAADIDHFWSIYDEYAEVYDGVRSDDEVAENIIHIAKDIYYESKETSVMLQEAIRSCESCNEPNLAKQASDLLHRINTAKTNKDAAR
ncbi:MAG: hypothetical protein FWB96_08270 [Defluviitaleaceae bacterium]|nr:hypothetical protein [Defluviitaleaceae bacterium]MCL2224945.1 hypothetical protein [Defluviitaleaceae bacterium]MCL2262494.1 hypothetical protein [Defluviitaleaceae bacterium]